MTTEGRPDLVALEKAMLDSPARHDEARLDQLLHPDFVEVGRSGVRWRRAEIMAGLLAETELPTVETFEWDVVDLADGVSMVTFELRQGHRVSRHVSIWLHGGNSMQLRYHQATVVNEVALFASDDVR